MSPSTPTTITSPKKRAVSTASPTKRATSTSSTRKTPRRSMAAALDEIIVKSEDEDGEYVNGSAVERKSRSPRKVLSRRTSETRVKGKPAYKVDRSGHFEFGGSFGTAAMMICFPVLMYYLWICSTFYGGRLQFKKGSETWLAFADRMVAHVTKVSCSPSD